MVPDGSAPSEAAGPGSAEEREGGHGANRSSRTVTGGAAAFWPAVMPRMPRVVEEGAAPEERAAHHDVHLTGESGPDRDGFAGPIRPLALQAFARPADVLDNFPLVLSGDPGRTVRPLAEILASGTQRIADASGGAGLVAAHIPRLCSAVTHALAARGGEARLGDLYDDAAAAFRADFDSSEAADAVLGEELARLATEIPGDATAVCLDAHTPLRLMLSAVKGERARRLAAFGEEIERLSASLAALLQNDARHGPEGGSPTRLSASLGPAAHFFVDPERLAQNLPAYRGSERLDPARRSRLELCLAELNRGRAEFLAENEPLLLHAGSLEEKTVGPGVRLQNLDDPLAASAAAFDALAKRLVDLVRAVRLARLALAASYEPARHDAVLERLDWQGLTTDELMLAPRVVVLETVERVLGDRFASFSTALRAGRPIQIVVIQRTSGLERDEAGSFHAPLATLSVAHREAFVLQSTLCRPVHLAEGVARLARSLRTGVAIIATPDWNAPAPAWLQLAAHHAARATPTLLYDPEAGVSWADRFELAGNAEPDADWATVEVRLQGSEAAEETLESP